VAARRVFDESIAEDAAFVSSSPQIRSTPFQPVSAAPRAAQQPPTGQQRLPRDVMPVAGRLNELRQATTTTGGMMRTSLFPTDGEGTNAAAAARSMGAPPAAVEGRLLEMGAERIAADRDRARQFIISQWKRCRHCLALTHALARCSLTPLVCACPFSELTQDKGKYMVANRELATRVASQEDLSRLKLVLSSRIKQLEGLQGELRVQQSKKETAAREQLDRARAEARQAREELEALKREGRGQVRADSAQVRELKREIEQNKHQAEKALSAAREEAATSEAHLRAEVEQTRAKHAQERSRAAELTEQVAELTARIGQHNDQQRRKEGQWQQERRQLEQMAAQAQASADAIAGAGQDATMTSSSSDDASTIASLRARLSNQRAQHESELTSAKDHARSYEVALENACNEVERLQQDLTCTSARSDAIEHDLRLLTGYYERACRKLEQAEMELERLEDERDDALMDARRKQIQIDELTDIKAAQEQAHSATQTLCSTLHLSVSTLTQELDALRNRIVQLLVESSTSFPVPLSAMDTHPHELAQLLADTHIASMKTSDVGEGELLLGATEGAEKLAPVSSSTSPPLLRAPFNSPTAAAISPAAGSAARDFNSASSVRSYLRSGEVSAPSSSTATRIESVESNYSFEGGADDDDPDALSVSMASMGFGSVARRLSMSSALDASVTAPGEHSNDSSLAYTSERFSSSHSATGSPSLRGATSTSFSAAASAANSPSRSAASALSATSTPVRAGRLSGAQQETPQSAPERLFRRTRALLEDSTVEP
jgi:hypothetical protein